ncbi:MAG: C39 family peptidase [Clostridia bacterium]|nr:C39 family peptidase [Clostridia bacterium]
MKKVFLQVFITVLLTLSLVIPSFASDVHEHSFGEWKTTSLPTKFDAGEKTAVCSVCGMLEVREITAVIKMTVGQSSFTVNGETKSMHCEPVIRNDRTMLPVRYVAENLGAAVSWNTASSTAVITNGSAEIKITIGDHAAMINGVSVPLDSPAFIESDRTYLPVRFIAESLGAAVEWDGETSTATITNEGGIVSKILDVPYIYQVRDYPNGCESVSTVMALQFLGFDIDVDTFIDSYLDMGSSPVVGGKGPDPDEVYCGNPRLLSGWGCNSPVIVNALNKFIAKDKYTVSQFYGKSLAELCEYINSDIPVIMWATVGMVNSSSSGYYAKWTTEGGKQISYNKRLHCLLLVGYDGEYYYFNDPMSKGTNGASHVGYKKSDVEKAYEILGMQSIVIEPK